MNADIKGALNNLNKCWSAFEHKGKFMTKQQVKNVLEYALTKGYKSTSEIKDHEVEMFLTKKI